MVQMKNDCSESPHTWDPLNEKNIKGVHRDNSLTTPHCSHRTDDEMAD